MKSPRIFLSILSLFWTAILTAQIPSTSIRLRDWDLSSLDSIRWGRFSVVRKGDRAALSVQALYASEPPVSPQPPGSVIPAGGGNCFLLTDFRTGGKNSLGGGFGVFERFPSRASASVLRDESVAGFLRVVFERGGTSSSGVWIHLFPTGVPSQLRHYLDATRYEMLSFWVRSSQTMPRVSVRIADAALQDREEAAAIGELASSLPAVPQVGVWHRVTIPLSTLPAGIDRTRLASIVLEPLGPLSGSFDIASMTLCASAADLPPLPLPLSSEDHRILRKALWVWDTDQMLSDSAECKSLIEFSGSKRFTDLFLSFPIAQPDSAQGKKQALRGLIAGLRRCEIRVHALFGDPSFLEPRKRAQVDTLLRRLKVYNAEAAPEERFVGLHYDVEPYLYPGFGSKRQEGVLQRYLALLESGHAFARSEGLVFGVDLPFWFDVPDPFGGEPPAVQYGGVRKPLYQSAIDIADFVVLMDYRTAKDGADGIVAHAEDELAYATAQRKEILVGLETGALPDEEIVTIFGRPRRGLGSVLSWSGQVVGVSRGDSAYFWVVGMREVPEFDLVLSQLELQNYHLLTWPRPDRAEVPGSKLSFAHLGLARLEEVCSALLQELRHMPSFAGIALHHYGSLRKLAAQRPD